jgi:ataxin-10
MQYYRTKEIIIPHQTTLLKLLDSYLQSLPNLSKVQSDIFKIHVSLGSFLAKRFFALSEYAQMAIHKSLGMTPYESSRPSALWRSSDSSDSESELEGTFDKTSALQQNNLMLVKVCEGLVLVTQCIVTISLGSEMHREQIEGGDSTLENHVDLKDFFNRRKYQESGMVESLIGALFCSNA